MIDKVQIGDALLIHADCLEWMESVPDCFSVGATITDPPYGIGFKYESGDDSLENWERLIGALVPFSRRVSRCVVLPVGRQQRIGWWYQNYPPDWLIVWHKGPCPTLSKIGFSDWEAHVFYGKPFKRMHDHFTVRPPGIREEGGHPCPKPVQYSEWFVSRMVDSGETVLDPFMGSGTTGVACANLGRRFIGVEKERKYFDIACDRIAAAYSQGRLFA